LIVFAYVAAWLIEPETFDWHGATIVVWIVTLFIQRAENRDKLELLHAHSLAGNAMTCIDEEQPEDIEQLRKVARRDA
jgi:hypothetical protein